MAIAAKIIYRGKTYWVSKIKNGYSSRSGHGYSVAANDELSVSKLRDRDDLDTFRPAREIIEKAKGNIPNVVEDWNGKKWVKKPGYQIKIRINGKVVDPQEITAFEVVTINLVEAN